MYLLELYVTSASLNINHPFTYYSDEEVKPFCRVKISFNHRLTAGFIYRVTKTQKSLKELENDLGFKVLKIKEIIDQEPIMSMELFSLAKWLSKVTVSPLIAALNVMLPKSLKTASTLYQPKKIKKVKKVSKDTALLTSKQKLLFDSIQDGELLSELNKRTTIHKTLLNKGYLEIYEEEYRSEDKVYYKAGFKELTEDQNKVYQAILASEKIVNLLFGVTGSGKTEVYLHLARHYLNLGKQVLILVPEIALTPQMIKRVKERFDNVAIYHSYLSDKKRHEEYFKVLHGEVKIVVGTRSSIFLPFNDLGLIIVDEEHDHSYKQDNVPCYSAKMVAFKRAKDFKAKVLLASATPSLEVYNHALKGDYGLFKLSKRINEKMPRIKIVDLNKEVKKGHSAIISEPLKDALSAVLAKGKQAIILINRKGYAPIVRCSECSEVLTCRDCDVSLSYHNDTNTLKCNVCGRVYPMPYECPKCHEHSLVKYGFGTKRVVEVLSELFKEAKIGRLDADNTSKKDAHEMILEKFARHEYDILVGTQMLAKGLDFEDVILVGILNADAGLMHEDFNSSEVTFDLLEQASGRSGRSKCEGEVIIQAFNPDHYVLKAVSESSYESFYKTEIAYRKKAKYPPFSHLVALYLSDENEKRLNKASFILYKLILKTGLKCYEPYTLKRLNRRHRLRILIKEDDLVKAINVVNGVVSKYLTYNLASSLKVDIDPLYLE